MQHSGFNTVHKPEPQVYSLVHRFLGDIEPTHTHTHSVTWLLREKEGMSICQDTILCQATSREELHANLNHIVRGYQEVSYISALLILVVANRRRGMPYHQFNQENSF